MPIVGTQPFIHEAPAIIEWHMSKAGELEDVLDTKCTQNELHCPDGMQIVACLLHLG